MSDIDFIRYTYTHFPEQLESTYTVYIIGTDSTTLPELYLF